MTEGRVEAAVCVALEGTVTKSRVFLGWSGLREGKPCEGNRNTGQRPADAQMRTFISCN